jgi:hypothetical protein
LRFVLVKIKMALILRDLDSYRLDDRGSIRHNIQTGSEAQAVSYQIGSGGSFRGSKEWGGREADHLSLSSAEVKNGGAISPRHVPSWRRNNYTLTILIYTNGCAT